MIKIPEWVFRFKLPHIFLWALCMALSFMGYYDPNRTVYSQIANVLVSTGFNSFPFYFTAYVLVPRYIYTRRFTTFILIFIAQILFFGVFVLFVTRMVDNLTLHRKWIIPHLTQLTPYINLFMWNTLLASFGASTFKILSDRFRIEKRLAEVEKEKIRPNWPSCARKSTRTSCLTF